MATARKPAAMDGCLARLKKQGYNIDIWGRHRSFIADNFGRGMCQKIEECIVSQKDKVFSKKLLIYCDEKEQKMSWLSLHTERIILNIAHGLGSYQFVLEFERAIKEADALKEELAKNRS